MDIELLEKKINYSFKNKDLIKQAFTHRSLSEHNERLEFLGDSVLGVAVSEYIYRRFSLLSEGMLTTIRSRLVNNSNLARVALKFGFDQFLILGSCSLKSGGHRNRKILAGAMEALIGAIYFDGGIKPVRVFLHNFLFPDIEEIDIDALQDSKSALQEWLQYRQNKLPVYSVISEKGASHEPIFEVKCALFEYQLEVKKSGTSIKLAEQLAAAEILSQLMAKYDKKNITRA